MGRAPTIKPKTNIPLVGTLKYADFYQGEYGLRLKLTGDWDEHGEGVVWLPATLEAELTNGGYIERTGEKDRFGQDGLKANRQLRLTLIKTESEDGKRTFWNVDGNGQAKAGTPTAKPAPQKASPPEELTGDLREIMLSTRNTYSAAMAMLLQVYEANGRQPPGDDALQAGTFSIFKNLTDRGVWVPAGKLPAPEKPVTKSEAGPGKESLDDFPEALEETDDELPF